MSFSYYSVIDKKCKFHPSIGGNYRNINPLVIHKKCKIHQLKTNFDKQLRKKIAEINQSLLNFI